jgi:hypothetical protein
MFSAIRSTPLQETTWWFVEAMPLPHQVQLHTWVGVGRAADFSASIIVFDVRSDRICFQWAWANQPMATPEARIIAPESINIAVDPRRGANWESEPRRAGTLRSRSGLAAASGSSTTGIGPLSVGGRIGL